MFYWGLQNPWTKIVGWLFIKLNSKYYLVVHVCMFISIWYLPKPDYIQEGALRFVLDDYISDYHALLKKVDASGIKITLLWYLVIGFINVWTLQWRHNERDGVSNHQPHDCFLNCLFRRRSTKTSKLRVTGLCEGNERYKSWLFKSSVVEKVCHMPFEITPHCLDL